MRKIQSVAITATRIEDGAGGNITVDEAAIPGSIEKENDTDGENNADRTNNPIGSCVSIKFGVGVLVGWRVQDDCHVVRVLWQVAVGASGAETGGFDTGLVEVFNRETVEDDFELFQVLMPQADGVDAEDSNFGTNIKMKSGYFIVISAPNFDTRNNGDRGKFYFYERTSLNLAFLPSNTYNGGCAGQQLGGEGIAIEGNNTSLQVHTMSENEAKDCTKNENNVRTWNVRACLFLFMFL